MSEAPSDSTHASTDTGVPAAGSNDPEAARTLADVAQQLATGATVQTPTKMGSRSQRIRSRSRAGSQASTSTAGSSRLVIDEAAVSEASGSVVSQDLTILASMERQKPQESPPSKKTRSGAPEQEQVEASARGAVGEAEGDPVDQETFRAPLTPRRGRARRRLQTTGLDEEEEDDDETGETISRLRFKTPATIRRRLKTALERAKTAEGDDRHAALVELELAHQAETKSHLSVIRSEMLAGFREINGRLNRLTGVADATLSFSKTAAAEKDPVTQKVEWEKDLGLPWATREDLEAVRDSRQLRGVFEMYLSRFLPLTPDVAHEFFERCFTDELAGGHVMPTMAPRVTWGILLEPLPVFVERAYMTLIRSKPRFEGIHERMKVCLINRLTHLRRQRRERFQDHLVEVVNDPAQPLPKATAAKLVLLDGREAMGIIDRPLDLSSSDTAQTFVQKFGQQVLDKMKHLYPVPTEYEAAVNACLVAFDRNAEPRE
jgi:hypothetical protein